MKTKTLLLIVGILCPALLFSQQPIYQLSDGGTPWGLKFAQYESEIPVKDMGPVDLVTLQQEDAINDQNKNGSFRFGYNHMVDFNLNNSGVWKTLSNGDKVWRLAISCPEALSINIAFQYLSIPDGGKLFIYNEDKSVVLGAFTQQYVSPDLMLGTELLPGEKIFVEYQVPASAPNVGHLEIFRITHGYRGYSDYTRAFGDAGACENNAMCPAYSAYANQIKSVVCLVSGGSEFCTGALINNTCNDGTPYVLTANHCGSSGFGSWVFRFNWQASGCTNPGSSPSSSSLSGGTQRAANPGSDMSLVQINSAVPAGYNAYFSGWDRNNTASVNQVAIHHPQGDIKKVSLATGTATTATYGSATCWQTGTWTDGVTEPGSSGSPLFNTSGLIVGQLYGGPSNCSCENNAGCGYDYYGKLFTSWTGGGTNATRLSNWLDPSGCTTGATTLNGYDPNAISLTYDAQVLSITSPSGTLCTGTHAPVIVLKNNGTTTLTSMSLQYSIDGGGTTTTPWSGSLASGASANFTMPNITIASGAHTYTVTIVTASLNGSNTDLNTSNNSLTSNYTGAGGTGVSLPFTEGFEGVTYPPTSWTNQNPDGNVGSALWTRTTSCSGFGGSTACSKIDQITPSATTAGQVDNLITPYLDLTTAALPQLTFSVANARYDATFYDSLIVSISTDCGSTWTRLASYGNSSGANQLSTAPDITTAFTPTAAQWSTKTIPLTAYASQTSAQIRFQLKSGWGNNTYVDDVNIQATPTTPPTASYTMNDNNICAGQSVIYTNTSSGATSFSWTFPGGSPSSGTTSPITVTYAAAGTYTTTLTATNGFGSNTTTQTVTVNPLPTVTSNSSYGTICDNVTPVTLTGGSPAGGTYSGTGVSSGQFNPAVSGSGTFNITYSYTDGNGCTNTAVGSIIVAPCSGIDDNDLSNVVLYPNPTTQFVNVKGLLPGEHTYSIISTLGQVIRTGVILGDGTIDLGVVAIGTYYIKIDNKFWKIIKQ